MARCCVHHIAGYPPCGEPSVEMVTLIVADGKLDVHLCQRHLEHIEQGIRETGRIPFPEEPSMAWEKIERLLL